VTDTPTAAPDAAAPAAAGPMVPASTYQLLRDRLQAVAGRLQAAANQVNTTRAELFASVPLALVEQDRLRTEQPSQPRDVVSVGDLLLFGFNISGALGRVRTVRDAFALYRVQAAASGDWSFTEVPGEDPAWFLADPGFTRDIGELFTYYADAKLQQLQVTDGRLLMVFSVGTGDDDVRVLRWQLSPDGAPPTYIDAYGDHDRTGVAAFDFQWREAGRELIVEGRWRHYVVENTLYVGIEQQRVEFRIDDAVAGGRTVHAEPLAEAQTIDELRVGYAALGDLLLIRLHPYREAAERFYIYNRLTRSVHRTDAVGRNCHQLPEGQGVVFPGGYHLQNGETKVFTVPSDNGAGNAGLFGFHAAHKSPNGEDILYVYHQPVAGEYLLCAYNVVSRTMATPVTADGYALFDDGLVVTIRHAAEPQRVHAVGVYTSPFCTAEQYAPPIDGASFHGRVGNPELVRVLGEAFSLARDALDPQFNEAVFEAMVARSTMLLDGHSWLSEPEACGIDGLLVELRKSAGDVLDEFSAVVSSKREAADRLRDAERLVANLVADAELELRDAPTYFQRLAATRAAIGELVELRDVREIDLAALAALEQRVTEVYERLATRAIEFLGSDEALATLLATFERAETEAGTLPTVASLGALAAEVDAAGDQLVLLTEVVGGLQVADSTQKTSVLSRLSDALARRNSARATIDARGASLRIAESAAAFHAGMAVLSQRTQALLMTASDTSACDAATAALSAELENLDLEFGDVPAHADAIATKRDEIITAFTQRRDALAAERAHRIDRLVGSAQRLVVTVTERSSALADRAAVDTYFSTDGLVAKVRSTVAELAAMGEAGPASELEVGLNAAREQARRTVADRTDLFEAGTVKIGRWKLGVNTEPFELRLEAGVAEGNEDRPLRIRLSGTDLVLPVPASLLGADARFARQTYPSETDQMPRALYLAFEALAADIDPAALPDFAGRRMDDGYEPGVHDADAATIIAALAGWWSVAGLRHRGVVRAVAGAWLAGVGPKDRPLVERELSALAALGRGRALAAFAHRVQPALTELAAAAGLADEFDVGSAVDWLVVTRGQGRVRREAADLAATLKEWADTISLDLRQSSFPDLFRWAADMGDDTPVDLAAEAAWSLLDPSAEPDAGGAVAVPVTGLRSKHARFVDGAVTLDPGREYTQWAVYRRDELPKFRAFADSRRSLLAAHRTELDLDRLRPKVISSFVRNRLIDETYLPMVGDNIARQLGLNGAAQGLLLLISPPGYGKTTLLEYVADLLGFGMVKINGPALGTEVTSLDPAAAPDAASAEELVKLNRAFGMANNVVCMIDDIQHTSPEFLQKFISLCDATRRVEGVVDGEARTFSLSGKRFVMAMAGNPYTSDGTAFRIPDMLANRADVHNLGDVATNAAAAFAQSYVENACGVNEVLAPVLSRGRHDLEVLLRAAAGGNVRSDELQHRYAANELQSVIATLGHLLRVRDTLLKVNAAYIASATVDNNLRGEPAFLLQGSYRNMARIAQRVLPAMNEAEIDTLVADHYRAESQTLAAAAGWNMLKLRAVIGTATAEELQQLDELRNRWRESNVAGDPLAVMANALGDIAAALERTDR
jgi:hypothetical protein